MPALHPLADVQSLALQGRIRMGSRCRDPLREWFDGVGLESKVRRFAKSVLAQHMRASHYCRTAHDMTYDARPCAYDIYAPYLGSAVLDAHGIFEVDGERPTGWMLKLAIIKDDIGKLLYLISFHPLEGPIQRADGTTANPGWSR